MKRSTITMLLAPSILIGVLVLSGCLARRPEPPRRHDCPSESLLVDVSVFPDGTTASSPLMSLPDGGETSIAVEIGSQDISVSQAVYPFQRPEGAEARFADELDRINKVYAEMVPVDLSHHSLVADRYDFRCSETRTQPRCFYLARYDNFYIDLILRTSSLDISKDVLVPVIQDIDRRMISCFEEHPLP